jgi:hypothetical protein
MGKINCPYLLIFQTVTQNQNQFGLENCQINPLKCPLPLEKQNKTASLTLHTHQSFMNL